ncbi:hypothetical protein BV900_27240 [Agrobacterium tumefaciens]|nr:hypothetical protein BV900_27240 [Agrobacterium tumefaciens]
MSVAGHGYQALPTVRRPLAPVARAAVNMLLAMLSGIEAPANRANLPAELLICQSTGPSETPSP